MEQRKFRRFQLQLPVALTRAGTQRLSEAGLTRNISSGGVLFTAEKELDIGGPIEYVITLNVEKPELVNIRCVGTVLRNEKVNSAFTVAATMERYEFIRK